MTMQYVCGYLLICYTGLVLQYSHLQVLRIRIEHSPTVIYKEGQCLQGIYAYTQYRFPHYHYL